jgi:hypothetical protein
MTMPTAWRETHVVVERASYAQSRAIELLSALPHRWVEWDGTVEAWVGGARLASTMEQGATTYLLAAEGFDPVHGTSIKARRTGATVDMWMVREVAPAEGVPVWYRDSRHVSSVAASGEGRLLIHRVYARREAPAFDDRLGVWRPWVAAFRGFVS